MSEGTGRFTAALAAADAARERAGITIAPQQDHEGAVDYAARVLRCIKAVNGGDPGLEAAVALASLRVPPRPRCPPRSLFVAPAAALITLADPAAKRGGGPDQPLPETGLGRLLRSCFGRHEDAERLGAWDGAQGFPPHDRPRFRGLGRGAFEAYEEGYRRGRLWRDAP